MTDYEIRGIAHSVNSDWWYDDHDLLQFSRALLARATRQPDTALLRQALEALEAMLTIGQPDGLAEQASAAITALRERLA